MRTGIFFHYQEGERLRDFPQALGGLLARDNVFLYDAHYPSKPASSYDLSPVPLELVYRVHTPELVERVKATGDFQGALFSASGTVAAAVRIATGEIDNAFVFTGYGDHHAGADFFGGGCYFNGAAIAIREIQARFGARRLAVIDTDAHHGNGTWEIFEQDPEVLYVCFCSARNFVKNNKVNIQLPWQLTDDAYLGLFETQLREVASFQPEFIFWNWGYDGTRGDYGDMGLSPDLHVRLARRLVETANYVCHGRLIVVLCGGSRRDLAAQLIPGIVDALSESPVDSRQS